MVTPVKIVMTFLIFLVFVSLASATQSPGKNITISTLPAVLVSSGSGGSSSSSGSGGMGVSTDEPQGNVALFDRVEKYWYYNTSVKYLFKSDIYEVVIVPAQNEGEVMVKLEILRDKSAKTTTPTGALYNYFNLYSGSKRFKDVTIRFRTDLNWDVDTVSLMKWTGKEWISLETRAITTDASNKYYEAKTDTFSNFAIVGTKTVVQPVATPAPTPLATPESTILPTTTINDSTNLTTPLTVPFPITGFELVIVICLIGYRYRKK